MPNSSSKLRLELSRQPRNVTLVLADRVRPATVPSPSQSERDPSAVSQAGGAPALASEAARRHFDIKELQRRAFERGREVERQRLAPPIAQLLERLAAAEAARESAHADDRRRVESFAVGLAMAVAERLTRSLVSNREHDVRAMVQDLLEKSGARDQDDEQLVLALDPEDHARLVELGLHLPDQMTAVGDPSLSAGDLVLRGRHHETWARLDGQLEKVRHELIEESQGADA